MSGMKINSTFDGAVGQHSVKQQLSLFIDAYKHTNRLPFINLITSKGGGKSFFARKFREGLKRSDGSRPPLLPLNGATLTSVDQFFEQVYPEWVNNNACLFLDEIHNIPKQLQQIFLDILDVKDDPIREVTYEDIPYVFDFRKISFLAATTDQQKLVKPLRDRFEDVCFDDYSIDELYQIFCDKIDGASIDSDVKSFVQDTLRGNPRDAVKKAMNMNTFIAAKQVSRVTKSLWKEFCSIMGVFPCGINKNEKRLIGALAGKSKGLTLTNLSCVTGFEAQVIQKEYESILMQKGLMEVDGRRKLTAKGQALAKQLNLV